MRAALRAGALVPTPRRAHFASPHPLPLASKSQSFARSGFAGFSIPFFLIISSFLPLSPSTRCPTTTRWRTRSRRRRARPRSSPAHSRRGSRSTVPPRSTISSSKTRFALRSLWCPHRLPGPRPARTARPRHRCAVSMARQLMPMFGAPGGVDAEERHENGQPAAPALLRSTWHGQDVGNTCVGEGHVRQGELQKPCARYVQCLACILSVLS